MRACLATGRRDARADATPDRVYADIWSGIFAAPTGRRAEVTDPLLRAVDLARYLDDLARYADPLAAGWIKACKQGWNGGCRLAATSALANAIGLLRLSSTCSEHEHAATPTIAVYGSWGRKFMHELTDAENEAATELLIERAV